jgi:hypothetical protein
VQPEILMRAVYRRSAAVEAWPAAARDMSCNGGKTIGAVAAAGIALAGRGGVNYVLD